MSKAKPGGTQTAKPTPAATRPRAPRKSAAPEDKGDAKPSAERRRAESKTQQLITLLRRANGANIEQMMSATGWQAHSVRGALSGTIKRKLGFTLVSEVRDGVRGYRIVEAQP